MQSIEGLAIKSDAEIVSEVLRTGSDSPIHAGAGQCRTQDLRAGMPTTKKNG
jgi:hypothetical protein